MPQLHWHEELRVAVGSCMLTHAGAMNFAPDGDIFHHEKSIFPSESMFGQLIGNGRVLASCLLAAGVRGTKVSDGASNIHTKS